MNTLSIFRKLGPVDLKNVRRDALLVWVPLLPLVLGLLLRSALPPLNLILQEKLAFDLSAYYPLIMSSFALTTSITVGMVIGFLLLDERDERILTALLVTPMPVGGYLLYRVSLPMLLGLGMTLVSYYIAGLAPVPFFDLLVVAGLGSFSAPVVALFLAAFAANKVAGFAMLKLTNAVLILPAAAYFVEMPWQLLAGIIPPYWPLKILWLAAEGQSYGAYAAAGLAVNLAAVLLLVRRFNTVLHR